MRGLRGLSLCWKAESRSLTVAALFGVVAAALLQLGCGISGAPGKQAAAMPVGSPIQINTPLGLPAEPIPPDNPPTAETVALGRRLFYDTRLSADGSIACASCHDPGRGFTDGQAVAKGIRGQKGSRSAPSLLNAAYYPVEFWDGRASSLEDQAGGPMANPIEMGVPHDVSVRKLKADPSYGPLFEKAFGRGSITLDKIEKCLASFERTLVSGDSPFDRYEYGHDPRAMSAAAIRGLAAFRDPARGNCVACHLIGKDYALLTDGKFHNIGVGVDPTGELTDLGRYSQTKVETDRAAFKTPTLRNVALTAPYMHDGSEKTLREVVDYYAGGANSNPELDPAIQRIHLTAQDRADLIAFLEALTGGVPPNSGPPKTE
jgi:cytochrome c peroxidase